MTDVIDAFHVKGGDGVIRSLDEHYDGMQDVAQDPYGAWLAIQNLCTRLAEVEAERDGLQNEKSALLARVMELDDISESMTAQLATARRDAWEDAGGCRTGDTEHIRPPAALSSSPCRRPRRVQHHRRQG